MFKRKKCKLPAKIYPSDEELAKVELPPKEKVIERANEIIKDEDVRTVIKEIIDAIYRLKPTSEFIWYVKTNALRYRLYNKPDKMTDFMVVMTLSFVSWCKDQVYGGNIKDIAAGKMKLEDLKEKECMVIAFLFEELRGQYTGVQLPKRKLLSIAYKWKKETGKIVKLWDKIEKNWCKW